MTIDSSRGTRNSTFHRLALLERQFPDYSKEGLWWYSKAGIGCGRDELRLIYEHDSTYLPLSVGQVKP